ncbi:hypothetical protein GCM10022278_17480 [Allohahella marinimesophila]|uniref:Uncharacterized protein n=1 Tax=Allohahella marinimesophila TaxID=1054972 RepID=A0ABP7P4U5_9GAMM
MSRLLKRLGDHERNGITMVAYAPALHHGVTLSEATRISWLAVQQLLGDVFMRENMHHTVAPFRFTAIDTADEAGGYLGLDDPALQGPLTETMFSSISGSTLDFGGAIHPVDTQAYSG